MTFTQKAKSGNKRIFEMNYEDGYVCILIDNKILYQIKPDEVICWSCIICTADADNYCQFLNDKNSLAKPEELMRHLTLFLSKYIVKICR